MIVKSDCLDFVLLGISVFNSRVSSSLPRFFSSSCRFSTLDLCRLMTSSLFMFWTGVLFTSSFFFRLKKPICYLHSSLIEKPRFEIPLLRTTGSGGIVVGPKVVGAGVVGAGVVGPTVVGPGVVGEGVVGPGVVGAGVVGPGVVGAPVVGAGVVGAGVVGADVVGTGVVGAGVVGAGVVGPGVVGGGASCRSRFCMKPS